MNKKFIQAITWNSINIFLYKTILLCHQIVLFYFISKEMYGISGTIFAAIYLLIGVTGFGFEYSLFSFFSEYSKSKQLFKQLITQYFVRLTMLTGVAIFIWYAIQTNFLQINETFLIKNIPISLIPYLLLIFITESMNRSLETLAQLAFLNKQITIVQISMIASYVILVWGPYFTTGNITLHNIFIPMTIASCIEIIFLLNLIMIFYNSLPESSKSSTYVLSTRHISKEQFFNYFNQVGKNLFSPNFLMLFIAFNLGMSQTGTIRFFTNIITLLYMFLNRSIGVPSGALFSNFAQQAFEKTRTTFLKITNAYIQLIYTLAIATITIIIPHIMLHSYELIITYNTLLFIAIGFIGYITLTYEKLFITQKSSHILALINLTSIIFLITTLLFAPITLSRHLLLMPICAIRLCTTIAIGLYSYKQWNISPRLAIRPQAIIIGLSIAIFINTIAITYQNLL